MIHTGIAQKEVGESGSQLLAKVLGSEGFRTSDEGHMEEWGYNGGVGVRWRSGDGEVGMEKWGTMEM